MMDLNISTSLLPNACYNNSAAASHTLEEFARQLSQASDPFELCLQTLPLDVFSPQDGKKTDRNWSTFRFPMFSGQGFNVLRVFSEWYLSLNDQTRTLVFHNCIQQPIVATCTESDALDSMCRLISLLHLQHQFSAQLCLIPVVISGAANYFLHVCEYLHGCAQPQLMQLSRDLRKLKSDHLQLSDLAKLCNVQIKDCRIRVEQCLDRCSKILLQHVPVQLSFDDADWFSHLINDKGGRVKVTELLCETFFPNASDPFSLFLEVFSIMRGERMPSLAHFRLPKNGTYCMAVIDAFSHWFHSLDDARKTHLVDSFIIEHIQAACSEGNFASMCRLVSHLRLQEYHFDPEMFLIPIQIQDQGKTSDLVRAYFEGCQKTLVERFATKLDALLLPINKDELVEFWRKCGVTTPLSHHALAKSIAGYKRKYSLDDTVVSNFLAVLDLPETENPICHEVFEIWFEENGRAKLVESLTQTHFPNAADPFFLCLQLLNSAQSWKKFRNPIKQSSYSATVIEAFRSWLQSLELDMRDRVFNEFMKQPITDACHTGNGPAMCNLLSKLDLYEKFENEDELFLIPTIFPSRRHNFVVDYLNGCRQETRERFLSKVDSFLAMNETELSALLEKCGIATQVQNEKIVNTVAFIQHNCGIPDSFAPNVMEFRTKEKPENTMNLISPSGPWKHLSPPQRMIQLYKENTQSNQK